MKKLMSLFIAGLLSVSLVGCGAGSGGGEQGIKGTPTVAEEGVEVSQEHPLVIDKEAKTIKVYATVNGKYTVEPTRHGLNFSEGKYGDQALFTSFANPTNFHDAMVEIGGTPGNNLTPDTAGQQIEGSDVDVTVTWDGAPKEFTMSEVVNDSTGKPIQYKFGGNRERSIEAFTGCLACFDSCPVGITSNSSHMQGEFANKEVEFRGNKDVLPADGTPVVVTFKLS
ncbi:YdjY domain-containing protein [Ammoniphilus resinae]|uniref:Ferredoxin n=1 Tax=Ammoniphilus resinae TaxID=861532 RepID=A0ABS4GS91_9BACL|nr:YdjY domain-containing protein [Ammoniphilus resinae]MBP1933153.1 ferredoxin [Ammoniphilus resinae]